VWALLRAARKAYKEWKGMDAEHRDAVAAEAQRVRALAIELGGAPAARFVDDSPDTPDGADAGAAPASNRPKEVVAGELREAVEALTRASIAPSAKVFKDSAPRSVRLGARVAKAGASRVMPRIQDRARSSSRRPAIEAPAEAPPPGWYPDPADRFDHRYWDGRQWTEHVSRNGSAEIDSSEHPPASRA
jgi:hypothetical protein